MGTSYSGPVDLLAMTLSRDRHSLPELSILPSDPPCEACVYCTASNQGNDC